MDLQLDNLLAHLYISPMTIFEGSVPFCKEGALGSAKDSSTAVNVRMSPSSEEVKVYAEISLSKHPFWLREFACKIGTSIVM